MYQFKSRILCLFLIAMLILPGCSSGAQQKPAPSNEPKETPKVVDEIITDIYAIMVSLDLIPYYKKEISKMKDIQEQQKEFLIKIGGGQASEGDKTVAMEAKDLIKYQQKPLEITDSIIFEVLDTDLIELDKKKLMLVPKDISKTWTEINDKIIDLNKKWNTLEGVVVQASVTQDSIKKFENVLNNLTISCAQNNQLDALFHCNKLVFFIPELIKNFKNIHPIGMYYMQYYLAQTVLEARINNYDNAKMNIDKLRTYNDYLKEQLIAKKATNLANKLETSIVDLNNALELKDMSIIKIKASIIMTNIVLAKDEFVK